MATEIQGLRPNNPIRNIAGRERRCRWKMRGVSWSTTSSIYYNVHLNSAIGYITPKDMLAGRQQEIRTGRDRKLEAATTASDLPAAGCMKEPKRYDRASYAK